MAWPTDANGAVTVTTAKGTNSLGFVPNLWSDEIIASFKSNLVLANLISNMSHAGKKGDTLYIPTPDDRQEASAKAATAVVALNAAANTAQVTVSINKHYEYSKLIEDIANIQALPSLRQYYTDDAGYALAKRVELSLWGLIPGLGGASSTVGTDDNYGTATVLGNDGSTVVDGDNIYTSSTGYNLTDGGIRRMIQTLDDFDVPLTERALIVPPVEKKNLLGISRYTEQAFVGDGSSIRSGLIGNIYGIPVYVTSYCPYVFVESDSAHDVLGTTSSTAPSAATITDIRGVSVTWSGNVTSGVAFRNGALIHKSSLVLVTQLGVRTQTQYKQEFLADLLTADTIYGVATLRTKAGVSFLVGA